MRKTKAQKLAEKYGLDFYLKKESHNFAFTPISSRIWRRIGMRDGEADATPCEICLWKALMKANRDILIAFKGGQVDIT